MSSNRTGFFSLSRKLRDIIYRHCWNDESRHQLHSDSRCAVVPFEDPSSEPQRFGSVGWRFSRSLLHPRALLVCKRMHEELSKSLFAGSHLLVSGLYFAIDEDLSPLQLEHFGVPRVLLTSACQIDLQLQLVPRHSFFQWHTVEYQINRLSKFGHNRYVGESRAGYSEYAARRFGMSHVELRTPQRAFQRFLGKLEPVEDAATNLELDMPRTISEPFDLGDFRSSFTRGLLLREYDSKRGQAREEVVARIGAMEAARNVTLPIADRLWWLCSLYEDEPKIGEILRDLLWCDFIRSLESMVQGLELFLRSAVCTERFRLILRTYDAFITGVQSALKRMILEIPALARLRNLECISFASRADVLQNYHTSNFEQWTSADGVRNTVCLESLIKESKASQPSEKPKIYGENLLGGLFEILKGYAGVIPGKFLAVRDFDFQDCLLTEFLDWPQLVNGDENEDGYGEGDNKEVEGISCTRSEPATLDDDVEESGDHPIIATLRKIEAEHRQSRHAWQLLAVAGDHSNAQVSPTT